MNFKDIVIKIFNDSACEKYKEPNDLLNDLQNIEKSLNEFTRYLEESRQYSSDYFDSNFKDCFIVSMLTLTP